MFPTLVALALIAPAQPGGAFKLSNIRNTYGELGGTRPEGKLLPGDILFVGFDIEGITVSDGGQVGYTMAMEVLDKAGKAIFKQDPAKKQDFVPLGGTKLPARAFVTIGLDQPAGEYSLKMTVSDTGNPAAQPQSFIKKFEVTKPEFGIVAVYTSVDVKGEIPSPTTGVVGQSVFVQFAAVGYDRDPKAKDPNFGAQPDLTFEMNVLDEAGKPTMAKPVSYSQNANSQVKNNEKDGGCPMRFLLPMTRSGRFIIALKATDNLTKKTATFDMPVTVVPPQN
jgi:hypothetical protein